MSKNLSRIVIALLVLVTLTTGAAHAAPGSSVGLETSPLTALWEWVTSWFQLSKVEEGSGMDPNGSTTEEGSGMDPNG